MANVKKKAVKKPPKIKGTNMFDIDEAQVEMLASKFWAMTEIAAFFNVSARTITDRFSNILIKGKETGKGRLRDAQLKAALGGNVTMLIWLGKQYLGQKETNETVISSIPEIKFNVIDNQTTTSNN